MEGQEPQNCWEFRKCDAATRDKCPAFLRKEGRKCWEVATESYGKGCPKAKSDGVRFCVRECEWFKKMNPQLFVKKEEK